MSTQDLDAPDVNEFRLKCRAWLAENMRPLERDRDGGYVRTDDSEPGPARVAHARELQAKLYDGGLAGVTFATEYGGGGLTLDHERALFEEAQGYEMPTQMFAVSLNILGKTLESFGTDDQKAKHLPRMLRGEEIWLQLLSEPSGGSDLAGMLTRATRDGDSYVLNGQKTWSTGAAHSDFAMCPARTNWDVPKHKGISVFIVDLNTPGIEIRPIKQINGGAEFCEEFITDAIVPAENMIGEENQGWAVARGLLDIEHEWVGRSGGGGSRASDVGGLVGLAKRRGLDGDVGVRRQIAQIHTLERVQALVAKRVSNGMADGHLEHGYGGMLKLGGDLTAQRRAELGLSLAGSRGIAWRDDAEATPALTYLHSRSTSIAGGTTEIQRNNLSERGLGLPREPSIDRDTPFKDVPRN
jgi:alkylation response protein AidB-like acyl-CoA dehydrogenase